MAYDSRYAEALKYVKAQMKMKWNSLGKGETNTRDCIQCVCVCVCVCVCGAYTHTETQTHSIYIYTNFGDKKKKVNV